MRHQPRLEVLRLLRFPLQPIQHKAVQLRILRPPAHQLPQGLWIIPIFLSNEPLIFLFYKVIIIHCQHVSNVSAVWSVVAVDFMHA